MITNSLKLAFEKMFLSSSYPWISCLCENAGVYNIINDPAFNIDKFINVWIQGFFTSFNEHDIGSEKVNFFTLFHDQQENIATYLYYETQLKHLEKIDSMIQDSNEKQATVELLKLLEQNNSLISQNSNITIDEVSLKILCWEHFKGFKLRPAQIGLLSLIELSQLKSLFMGDGKSTILGPMTSMNKSLNVIIVPESLSAQVLRSLSHDFFTLTPKHKIYYLGKKNKLTYTKKEIKDIVSKVTASAKNGLPLLVEKKLFSLTEDFFTPN